MDGLEDVLSVDLTIDHNDLIAGALDLMKVLRPEWPRNEIRHNVFAGGHTNKLVGCYMPADTAWTDMVLVRVYGAMTDLIIDRWLEMVNMVILHSAGCSGKLYCRFNNGIAYEYMIGERLYYGTVLDPVVSRLVAKEIVKMQGIQPEKKFQVSREPYLFGKLRQYLDILPSSFSDPGMQERYQRECKTKTEFEAEVDLLQTELENLNSPAVFSHGDLVLLNIIYNDKQGTVTFIDYEYGGFNYEAYEIGNHFCEYSVPDVESSHYPDKAYQLKWLRTFLQFQFERDGKPVTSITDTDVERLYVQVQKFALASHMLWGLWALIQAKYSAIDYDYISFAVRRLDEYFRRKEEFLSLKMPE